MRDFSTQPALGTLGDASAGLALLTAAESDPSAEVGERTPWHPFSLLRPPRPRPTMFSPRRVSADERPVSRGASGGAVPVVSAYGDRKALPVLWKGLPQLSSRIALVCAGSYCRSSA